MSTAILASLPVSLPKVHRLPPRPPETRKHQVTAAVMNYGNMAKVAFTVSSFALVIVLSVLFADQLFPTGGLHQDVVVKTAIAVDPISDAEALGFSSAASGKAIVLKEQDGTIVGQMAKIIPSAPPADITTSEIDNRKGRELLSIVDKH